MDRYPISCWTYFPLSEAWPELAQDFRDLGFTNPMTPVFSEGDDPAVMHRLLDSFLSEGLQVILYDNRVTAHSLKGADDALIREMNTGAGEYSTEFEGYALSISVVKA